VLVRLWKDKNMEEIKRVYYRSSINLLLIAVFIFGNIWLNAADGLDIFNVQENYKAALPLIFVYGFVRLIDAGTGLNAQVIGSSNFWRFEFLSGVIMLALRIPLVYMFIKEWGIIGSVYGDLISLSVYNFIRFEFLRRKFNMQPFSWRTLHALILGLVAYFTTLVIFENQHTLITVILRSILFSGLVTSGVFAFKITPDAMQLLENVRKRIGR